MAYASGSAGTQVGRVLVSIQHPPLNLSETLEGDSDGDNPYVRGVASENRRPRFVRVNVRHKRFGRTTRRSLNGAKRRRTVLTGCPGARDVGVIRLDPERNHCSTRVASHTSHIYPAVTRGEVVRIQANSRLTDRQHRVRTVVTPSDVDHTKLFVMRRPLAPQPLLRARGRITSMWFARRSVVSSRLGKNVAEHTSEPGPSCTGPARSVLGVRIDGCCVAGSRVVLLGVVSRQGWTTHR